MEGKNAHLAVLERDGLAGMAIVADSVEADDFASHVIPDDLFAAILGKQYCLEGSQPNCIHRVEWIAGPVQAFALPDPRAIADDRVELPHGVRFEAHRQAQLAHAAGMAVRLELVQGYDGRRRRYWNCPAADRRGHVGADHRPGWDRETARASQGFPPQRL